jgi:hypothetical protein
MSYGNSIKIVLIVVLFAAAGFGFYRSLSQKPDISEKNYFYDLSEKKLFAASREELPPIQGVNDSMEDAVRAIVICAAGNPDDPANRSIAYLEKYAPELKQNIEQARLGKAEPMKTRERNGLRQVARAEDAKWFPADTREGQHIMTNWNVVGASGSYPIVCSP